ncbi:MAG: tetratricopeptide repeat protein [Treponema sp.]|jgi:tetratricopeptide (TPR) repeat protein|nr:tetratricopeptide repeat protein [Treponema sp.]
MPSLQDLEAFKSSFLSVGGEADKLAREGRDPEPYPLPDSEPDSLIDLPSARDDTGEEGFDDGAGGSGAGLDGFESADDAGGSGGFLDPAGFSDLLGGTSAAEEVPEPALPDETATEENVADENVREVLDDIPDTIEPAPGAAAGDGADDFSLPDELLQNYVDESALAEEPPVDAPPLDVPPVDETPVQEPDSETENLPPEEPAAEPAPEAAAAPVPEADETTGQEVDQGTETEPAAEPAAEPEAAAESPDAAGPPADETTGQEVDQGTETEPAAEPAAEPEAPPSGEFGDLGGMELGAAPAGSGAAAAAPAEDEVEEILLSEGQTKALLKTLESYPLNLRIACEELIVEEAVEPEKMAELIRALCAGAPAREAAAIAGRIQNRIISIPKGFERKSGAELDAEESSFGYIFRHKFLPVLRLVFLAAAGLISIGLLIYWFIVIPLKADSLYKAGLERINANEYTRANERFLEAFRLKKVKKWFYRYADAFREKKQYQLAEGKYDELLAPGNWPGDKKGILDYAHMETFDLKNYEKAERLLFQNMLDFDYDADKDILLARGDNFLEWAALDSRYYESAREMFAKVMELFGQTAPVLERMLKFFIRTDNLKETLPLQHYFMGGKNNIAPETLAELGGYLLDKRFAKVDGVPNEYLDSIGGIREILLRVHEEAPNLPEGYYHLARYYHHFGSPDMDDERLTLERAVKVFAAAEEEPVKRLAMRIDTHRMLGEALIRAREFFTAGDRLREGVRLYEEGLERRVLGRRAEFGRLYADLGDLAYFTQDDDMEGALRYYGQAESAGYDTPELRYRMGAAHYHLKNWGPAFEYIFSASRDMPLNRRVLYALGNTAYQRGDYFAAETYYNRLLDLLQNDFNRFRLVMPNETRVEEELAERLMTVQNNLAVTLEALTRATGDNKYRSRAMGLYADSARAWDRLTRDQQSMERLGSLPGQSGPGVNPAYLNVQNALHPLLDYEPQFYYRIDKDGAEPSEWEALVRPGYRLSGGR